MAPDDDLPPDIRGLAAAVAELTDHVNELAARVEANNRRITTLERWGAEQAASLTAAVDVVSQQNRRERWLRTLRK